MDSQDYLDQISASSRPINQGFGGKLMKFLTSKYAMWGGIALGALVVILIFGSILGSGKKVSVADKCLTLKSRLDGTLEVISEYQTYVKSSSLRSLSASLQGVFTNTASQLGNYITAVYGPGENDEAILEEAELNKIDLTDELFEAKINGYLDRIYAHKMALEIYSVMSDEADITKSSSEAELNSILSSSYDSLNNLYDKFNDFSETK